jgi:hypothetical protein
LQSRTQKATLALREMVMLVLQKWLGLRVREKLPATSVVD